MKIHKLVFSSPHFFFKKGELRTLYRVTPIAVIGGSFLPEMSGHNLAEAAAAGCAVLTGDVRTFKVNILPSAQ